MESRNDKISKSFIITIVFLTVVLASILGYSLYSYFNVPSRVDVLEIDGGSINLTYSDDVSALTINHPKKIGDVEAKKINSADMYFDFSIFTELSEATKISYDVIVTPNKKNTIKPEYIKVYLEKVDSGAFTSVIEPLSLKNVIKSNKSELSKDAVVIYKNTLQRTKNDTYRLRAWVDSNCDYQLKDNDLISLDIDVYGKAI